MNNLFGQKLIKSISFDEVEILKDIISLHCPNGFELDPTYSIGSFYNRSGIPKPKYKYDIKPQAKGVIECSAENLPHEDNAIESIMFDPPFITGSHSDEENIGRMKARFGYFRHTYDLWEWYKKCLIEFKRILKKDGVLVFKNQDAVDGTYNFFSHCKIMNMAIEVGFYPIDLFILLAKSRIINSNTINQHHARKFHCYYWVFISTKSKVDYSK